jgi:phage FluMu protein Com
MRHEWRCTSCGKLLGIQEGARLSIRFSRGYAYNVALPAEARCWRCGAVNELRGQVQETEPGLLVHVGT